MRKMALTLLAGLMLCCFAACGSSDAKNVETTEPTQIATTPVQVKVEETDPAAVLETRRDVCASRYDLCGL